MGLFVCLISVCLFRDFGCRVAYCRPNRGIERRRRRDREWEPTTEGRDLGGDRDLGGRGGRGDPGGRGGLAVLRGAVRWARDQRPPGPLNRSPRGGIGQVGRACRIRASD